MKVLVGYDGSARSEAALDDLARAGLGDRVEVQLLSVAEVWLPPADAFSGPSVFEAAMRDAAAEARNSVVRVTHQVHQAAQRLRQRCPQWQVTALAETGSPADRIVERAEQWSADLIVVGAQGHTTLERLGLGSVSLKVLMYSRRPVRVARRSDGSGSPLRIVVGVDGSTDAEAAVDAVCGRNWPAGSEARVVVAADHRILAYASDVYTSGGNAETSNPVAIANAASRRLREAGLSTTQFTTDGDPKRVLVEEARTGKADCVFVGARGLGRVERFLVGSVSASVAMHAPCSVEVVHAGVITSSAG